MSRISRFGVPKNYFTVSEFAKESNVHATTVQRWIDHGLIKKKYSRQCKIVDDKPGTTVVHESQLKRLPFTKEELDSFPGGA